MSRNSRPVYSTESGRLCPDCGQAQDRCRCRDNAVRQVAPGGAITIQRERKGRAGKEVTVVRNLPLNAMELRMLASTLRKHCGSGGTVQQDTIEIQGDHRNKVKNFLQEQGYEARLAGG